MDRLGKQVGFPRAYAPHPDQHDTRRKLEPDSANWRRAHVVGTRLQLPHPASLVSRERERLQVQGIHDRHLAVDPPYGPTTTPT